MSKGFYSVYATSDLAGCPSDTISFEITRSGGNPVITITELAPRTNCENPNGILTADVGGQTVGYTFEWYEGNNIFTAPLVSVGPTAMNLDAITYTVLVTEISTGCQSILSENVTNGIVIPNVTATVLADTLTLVFDPHSVLAVSCFHK